MRAVSLTRLTRSMRPRIVRDGAANVDDALPPTSRAKYADDDEGDDAEGDDENEKSGNKEGDDDDDDSDSDSDDEFGQSKRDDEDDSNDGEADKTDAAAQAADKSEWDRAKVSNPMLLYHMAFDVLGCVRARRRLLLTSSRANPTLTMAPPTTTAAT
jgi:hypothetical protein